MKINWNEPQFKEKELELVKEVLDAGYVSEGPKTKELEEKLAKVCGTKHVIMTTSCTAALYLAIEADKTIRGYSSGEVIIPDLTFVATKNAVEMAGLEVCLVDVNENDYTLYGMVSVQDIPKIIIPVNLLGRDAHMDVCTFGTIICDNAGALGSEVSNGKVGCYSLQGNKIISCGQGGFCVTDDDEYAKVIREIKDFGRNRKEDNDTVGFNFKFNDILAAVALGQLELLDERKKLLHAQHLKYRLSLEEYGSFIEYSEKNIPLWVEFFPYRNRDKLIAYLKKCDIDCMVPWKPITGLYNSKYYYETCIWLPNGPSMTNDKQKFIIDMIEEFHEN